MRKQILWVVVLMVAAVAAAGCRQEKAGLQIDQNAQGEIRQSGAGLVEMAENATVVTGEPLVQNAAKETDATQQDDAGSVAVKMEY